MSYDEYTGGGGGLRSVSLFGVFVGCIALGALALSFVAYSQMRHDRSQVVALQGRVEQQLAKLRHRNAALGTKVNSTAQQLKRKDAGIAPLAARVLKSVFTIQTPDGWLGAGFAAWRQDGDTYFVTANHVVSHTIENNYVDVKRKGGSWAGEVMVRDSANDLALIRVSGSPPGAAPLWQDVRSSGPPHAGDQLLLVGSPYGLEGTVTTGIVSRVTRRLIQTDAAANPGNSGGPAIDKQGHVVGVLVSGGGENLNFAVPIGRACVKLRSC
jgi:S1-C subfamily serine protease